MRHMLIIHDTAHPTRFQQFGFFLENRIEIVAGMDD